MTQEVGKAKYKIIGLVDIFDEQNNITGQYPVGSIQELPIDKGTSAIEAGTAELSLEDEADAGGGGAGEADATGETGESELDEDEEDEDAEGATGEEEVE